MAVVDWWKVMKMWLLPDNTPHNLNKSLLEEYKRDREKPLAHWLTLERRRDELHKQMMAIDASSETHETLWKLDQERKRVSKDILDHHVVVEYLLAQQDLQAYQPRWSLTGFAGTYGR